MLKAYHQDVFIEAGTDEAGRGCLAGPVFAAAVILPRDFDNAELRDSKKLNLAQREQLYECVRDKAIDYAVAKVTPARIDKINILNASIEAMHKSLNMLGSQFELVLVDGNRFKPYKQVAFKCFVKGDDKYFSIAAASVLAKVERDRYMMRQAEKYPHYGWETNKGYPTKKHREAIRAFGPSPIHRMSFKLLEDNPQLPLF